MLILILITLQTDKPLCIEPITWMTGLSMKAFVESKDRLPDYTLSRVGKAGGKEEFVMYVPSDNGYLPQGIEEIVRSKLDAL
jgi:hypothetical protein